MVMETKVGRFFYWVFMGFGLIFGLWGGPLGMIIHYAVLYSLCFFGIIKGYALISCMLVVALIALFFMLRIK